MATKTEMPPLSFQLDVFIPLATIQTKAGTGNLAADWATERSDCRSQMLHTARNAQNCYVTDN